MKHRKRCKLCHATVKKIFDTKKNEQDLERGEK